MGKPWEEEWFVKNDPSCVDTLCRADEDGKRAIIAKAFGPSFDVDSDDGARLELAAAAPDLYRALAAQEWAIFMAACEDCGCMRRCPCCQRCPNPHAMGHEPGCALFAALKKARGE